MDIQAELSPRESEIAEYLAWGAPKKSIAKKLFISLRTVENTARNIYEKTRVNNVAQLAAWWFCKKFNISTKLNPMLAASFLLIMAFSQPSLYKTYKAKEDPVSNRRIKEVESSEQDDDLFN